MDLVGWDLVFAIGIEQVNAALTAQKEKLVRSFDFTAPVAASGAFGDWRIVEGGSGDILQMQIAIESGTLAAATGPVAIGGSALTIQVKLNLLPLPSGVQQLGLDLDSITFVSFENMPAGVGEIAGVELGTAFTHNLSQQASQVTFVLASVSPMAAGAPSWLSPTALRFAYVLPDGGKPTLGIFAVVDGRDVSSLQTKVDSQVIGSGGVGFALAPQLFLANVFAPALASALGFPAASLVLAGDTKLTNQGNLPLHSVSEAGEDYHPKLTSMSAELVDDRINLSFAGDCDLGMNISMSFNGSSSVGLTLGASKALSFITIGTQAFDKDVDIPWYDHLLDIAGGVAEIILQVTVAAISSELSDGISQVAGTTALVSEAPAIVGWVGTSGFNPTAAGLAGGFWLHGDAPQ